MTTSILDSKPTPTVAEARKALVKQWDEVRTNFLPLLAACTTDAERNAVTSLFSASRDAFWKSTSAAIEEGNPLVAHIYADLAEANKKIEGSLQQLQTIKQKIDFLTGVVKLATSLATVVGV